VLIDVGLLKKYIDDNFQKRDRLFKLYQSYKGKELPILQKEVSKTSKANNKIKNDYRGIIVDQHNGYLFGKPIRFNLDSLNYDANLYPLYDKELQRFLVRNNADDSFAETDKMSRICGYGVWYLYHDEQAKERIMEINPWECIFVDDERTGENTLAIRYYPVTRLNAKNQPITVYKAEVHTATEVWFYVANEKGDYELDSSEVINPLPHIFGKPTLIRVDNNSELMGDFEKVEELIDKYDFLVSTVQDEIDQFRLAYMLITGAEIDDATLARIKESGTFSGLEPEDKVEFITKQINDTFIENQKKTLNENIYKFSATPDMFDQAFSGGAESGEAKKWKLLAMENKAIIKERKFSKALRDLFERICHAWNVKGMPVDYLDVYWTFSRNVPVDLLYLAQVATGLKGQVSEDTRLSVLGGLVDDVEWEKQKMKEEAQNVDILGDAFDKSLLDPNAGIVPEDGK
jgi:SPP1 family phage portal protein